MIAPKEITLTINGQSCRGVEGQTILEVATANKIYIPTLCYLKHLSTWGGCRMCIVEVAGNPKIVPACATPAVAGSVVTTNSDRVRHLRRVTLELLFSERNHYCPYCEMNKGDCELQQMGYRFEMESVRFPYLTPAMPTDHSARYFAIDHNRCILCTRCVRTCDEIEGVHTLDVVARGERNRIMPDLGGTFGASETCTLCGACVAACPTGALFDKGGAFRGKLNTCQTIKTTCTECPVGCGLLVFTKENRIVNVFGDPEHPVNRGHLCVHGRYETWAEPRRRFLEPRIRKNGVLEPVSWAEARAFIAGKLAGLKPEEKGLLVSPRLPNEAAPVVKKLAGQFGRVGMWVSEHETELCEAVRDEKPDLNALRDADAIIVLGAQPSQANGVVAALVRVAARKHGAKLLVFHSRNSDLDKYADIAANVVSLERAFWRRVAATLENVKRPVLVFGPRALTPIGVQVMERLMEIFAGQSGQLTTIGLPVSANAVALAAAGIEPVEETIPWIDAKPLKYLHIVASDEPDGGARVVEERHARGVLEQVDCIVVQASYRSALTDLATVVLPAAATLEKAGTLTNLEGRAQTLTPVIPARGQAKEDKAILEEMFG
jgi:formate dehydrogenase major subunit